MALPIKIPNHPPVVLVTMHLPSDRNLANYQTTLDDLGILLAEHPGRPWVCGTDTQIQLGPCLEGDDPELIGAYGKGERDRDKRTEALLATCGEYRLAALNTFPEGSSTYTYFHDLRSPARQIDYFLASTVLKRRCCVIPFSSSATSSDHGPHKLLLCRNWKRRLSPCNPSLAGTKPWVASG